MAKDKTRLLPSLSIRHNHQRFDLDIVYDGPEADPVDDKSEIPILYEPSKNFEGLQAISLKQENVDSEDHVNSDSDSDSNNIHITIEQLRNVQERLNRKDKKNRNPPVKESYFEVRVKNEGNYIIKKLGSDSSWSMKEEYPAPQEEESQEAIRQEEFNSGHSYAEFTASGSVFLVIPSDDSDNCDIPIKQLKKETNNSNKNVKKSGARATKETVKWNPSQPNVDYKRKYGVEAKPIDEDQFETVFTITSLSTEEQLACMAQRQASCNYKNSVFKCTDCYQGFNEKQAYQSHILQHTIVSNPLHTDFLQNWPYVPFLYTRSKIFFENYASSVSIQFNFS